MSVYESYDEVSADYDKTRVPIGAEIIADCLAGGPAPLSEVSLLDAGCGSGAYSAAMVDRVGHVDAIDLNGGMLAVARLKLRQQERQGRIAFHQGNITELPFAEGRFDGLMANQVLHHLDSGEDPALPVLDKALAHFHRVLKPGGVVVINTCTREQLRRGYWYYGMIPEALKRALKTHASLEGIEEKLTRAGFEPTGHRVPLDQVMQGQAYFDPRGPLKPEWRKGDSIWAMVSAEELAKAEARVRAMDGDGALDDYVAERDSGRAFVGQFTFIHARKG